MHRLRSTSTLYRFRIAAWLLCLKYLLLPFACAVLIHAVYDHDPDLTLYGFGLIGLTLLVLILQWLVASRTGCPLCMTPLLARQRCVPHRHAKTFLGSHRLRVALTIVFFSSFRCPYCYEPTLMAVRVKKTKP